VRRMIERLWPSLASLLLVTSSATLHAQDAEQWGFYSANRHTTRYSPLAQIDASNVARLRVAWRHPQVDPAVVAANPDLTV
jgi:glucose dehydrogenase